MFQRNLLVPSSGKKFLQNVSNNLQYHKALRTHKIIIKFYH